MSTKVFFAAFVLAAAVARAEDGNIILMLEGALPADPANTALRLDAAIVNDKPVKEAWGFAPRYNGMDHRGELLSASASADTLTLKAKLALAAAPTGPGPSTQPAEDAEITVNLQRKGDQLRGTFSSVVKGTTLQGQAHGTMRRLAPTVIAGFVAPKPGEHPRLIYRASDLPALRQRATDADGETMLKRLRGTLNIGQREGSTQYEGHKATGRGFLYQITQQKAEADAARQLIAQRILNFPMEPRLSAYERAARILGTALAYDQCYDAWEPEFRARVAEWLKKQSETMLAATALAPMENRRDKWHLALRASIAVAAMAVINDPEADDRVGERLALARQSIKVYLDDATGAHGWDAAGDTAQLLALCHGILPFMQAARNTLGEDWSNHPHMAQIFPLLMGRLVPTVGLPAYGPGAAPEDITGFWTMGFASMQPKYQPAAAWMLNRLEVKKFYDITLPHHGVYAMVNFPKEFKEADPATVLPKAFHDETHGYFLFRNHWQDRNDIAIALNLEREPTGSIPNPGAFRIVGLGNRWVAGDSRYRGQDAVVYADGYTLERGGKVVGYWPAKEGAGGGGVVTLDTSACYVPGIPARSRDKIEKPAEPLKPLKSLRSFGIDFSGAAGAPALIAIVDKFDGGGAKRWNMRTERGPSGGTQAPPVEYKGSMFTARDSDSASTLQGTFVVPQVPLQWAENDRFRHKAGIEGTNAFFVIMTLQHGEPPVVKVSGKDLDAVVTVGKQTVRFDGQRIVFGQ